VVLRAAPRGDKHDLGVVRDEDELQQRELRVRVALRGGAASARAREQREKKKAREKRDGRRARGGRASVHSQTLPSRSNTAAPNRDASARTDMKTTARGSYSSSGPPRASPSRSSSSSSSSSSDRSARSRGRWKAPPRDSGRARRRSPVAPPPPPPRGAAGAAAYIARVEGGRRRARRACGRECRKAARGF
jgi:hypothetical protein